MVSFQYCAKVSGFVLVILIFFGAAGGFVYYVIDEVKKANNSTEASTIGSITSTCPTGYTRHPSGSCVDLLTDFNNCGSINYVCSSYYTGCSNGICSSAPSMILSGGVSLGGWGGLSNTDDAMTTIVSTFAISMYGVSTTSVIITTNGCICLGACNTDYTNSALPSTSFNGPTAFGYWDDLFIYAGTSQGVYYDTTGTHPNRALIFQYYTARSGSSSSYCRFQIVFYENMPNIVRYFYYQSSDGGASATIGTQASSYGRSITYSNNVAYSVPVGSSSTTTPVLTLTFNTSANTYTTSYG